MLTNAAGIERWGWRIWIHGHAIGPAGEVHHITRQHLRDIEREDAKRVNKANKEEWTRTLFERGECESEDGGGRMWTMM